MEIKGPELNQKPNHYLSYEQIGNAVFKSDFSSKLKRQLIKTEIQKVLNQNEWTLNNNKYTKEKWCMIFRWMLSTSCKHLNIKKNSHTQIIKELSYPKFTLLSVLNLQDNRITNIQPIEFLDCQQLQILILRDNSIIDLKPLNKVKWNVLTYLDLSRNHLNKLNVSRIKIGQVSFKLILQSLNFSQNFMEDMNILFKSEINTVSQIVGISNNRIYQKKIPKMIRKKWPDKSVAYFKDFIIY